MENHQLEALLEKLLNETGESEWLEFKTSYYEPQVLGEYLSALSNAACIASRDRGYLVFGIDDATGEIKGTSFNPSRTKQGNQSLEFWLNQNLHPKIGLEIHEFTYNGRNVVIFAVNAANREPVRFCSEPYVRIDSSKVSLKFHPELQRRIWTMGASDWTAQTPHESTLDHLDSHAIAKAREQFKIKHQTASFSDEINTWDDITFLNKARLTIEGRITNTALILLGKPGSVHLIAPSVARMTWILRDRDDTSIDYQHFDPPFLLNVDRLFAKIRNNTIRELPQGTLFPVEITQYDSWVMREALNNCIAHQDYSLCGRILVIERPDSLTFCNAGDFIPGSVEEVLHKDAPQNFYPNRFLTDAMVNLNMIDTIGSGIRRMFVTQKKRCMPMPDYDLSINNEVKVKMEGRILDENYTMMLLQMGDISLETAILLDRIQKKQPITKEQHQSLRKQGVVEGRFPNIYVSADIAGATDSKAQYTRHKAFEKKFLHDYVIMFLKHHQKATPGEIHVLLEDKLSDLLTDKQRKDKIRNILQEMSRDGLIKNIGAQGKNAVWVLSS